MQMYLVQLRIARRFEEFREAVRLAAAGTEEKGSGF